MHPYHHTDQSRNRRRKKRERGRRKGDVNRGARSVSYLEPGGASAVGVILRGPHLHRHGRCGGGHRVRDERREGRGGEERRAAVVWGSLVGCRTSTSTLEGVCWMVGLMLQQRVDGLTNPADRCRFDGLTNPADRCRSVCFTFWYFFISFWKILDGSKSEKLITS
jgi:hypothetical protein